MQIVPIGFSDIHFLSLADRSVDLNERLNMLETWVLKIRLNEFDEKQFFNSLSGKPPLPIRLPIDRK